jgi:hypothetical protein
VTIIQIIGTTESGAKYHFQRRKAMKFALPIVRGAVRKYLVDTGTNIVFWDSAWLVVFLVVRLSWSQLLSSEILGTVSALFLARPYGMVLNRVRTHFHTRENEAAGH